MGVLGLLLLVLLILLVTPFGLSASGRTYDRPCFKVRLHWFSPRVLCLAYDSAKGEQSLKIFGRVRSNGDSKKQPNAGEEDSAEPSGKKFDSDGWEERENHRNAEDSPFNRQDFSYGTDRESEEEESSRAPEASREDEVSPEDDEDANDENPDQVRPEDWDDSDHRNTEGEDDTESFIMRHQDEKEPSGGISGGSEDVHKHFSSQSQADENQKLASPHYSGSEAPDNRDDRSGSGNSERDSDRNYRADKQEKTPGEGKSQQKQSLSDRFRRSETWFFFREKKIAGKLLRLVIRFFKALFRIIKLKRLEVSVRGGTPDPSMTGSAYGYIKAAQGFLASKGKTFRLSAEPVFGRGLVLEAEGGVVLKTSLFRLMYPVLTVLFTFPYLNVLLVFFRYRRFKRKKKLS